MDERIIVELCDEINGVRKDLDIPLNITAEDLFTTVTSVCSLALRRDKVVMVSENPIAYLEGEKTLDEFGLYNGSKIIIKIRRCLVESGEE